MGKVDGPADAKKQLDAGIQVIKLDDAQAKILLKAAYDGGWEQIIKASPQQGAEAARADGSRSKPMRRAAPGRRLMPACGIAAALLIGVMTLLVGYDVLARNLRAAQPPAALPRPANTGWRWPRCWPRPGCCGANSTCGWTCCR